jgi:hypothetical protein
LGAHQKPAGAGRVMGIDWTEERPGWYQPCGEGWWEIRGKDCLIMLLARPAYCDRGNWLAQLHARAGSELALDLDPADMWPRYYFDLERAKLEVVAWLEKRGQKR